MRLVRREHTLLHFGILELSMLCSIQITSFYKIINWTGKGRSFFSLMMAAYRVGVRLSDKIMMGSICLMYSLRAGVFLLE